MHRFPYLAPGDEAPEYERMWRLFLNGPRIAWYANAAMGLWIRRILRRRPELEAEMGDRTGLRYIRPDMHWVNGRAKAAPYTTGSQPLVSLFARILLSAGRRKPGAARILKSVHSPLSMAWIASRFPVRVMVILRNPFSLYASYKRLRLPDGYRNLLCQPNLQRDWLLFGGRGRGFFQPEPEDHLAFQIMCMYKIMQTQVGAHPDWMLVSHDRLCLAPEQGYSSMFEDLHIPWSSRSAERVEALNRPGDNFVPSRVSTEEPGKWKSDLTQKEEAAIQRWTDAFELGPWFDENVNAA
jgi:hypothetical protein